MPFSPIWDAVKDHFFASGALSRVVAMYQSEVQVEGWWKGELIWLLGQLKSGLVGSWDRECGTGKGGCRMDFRISVATTAAAVEVKAFLCGPQKGQTWKLRSYVTGGFVHPDILKLADIQLPNRYLLVFAYRSPERIDWQGILGDIPKKAPGISVSLPRVDKSAGRELSIGWLQVT